MIIQFFLYVHLRKLFAARKSSPPLLKCHIAKVAMVSKMAVTYRRLILFLSYLCEG